MKIIAQNRVVVDDKSYISFIVNLALLYNKETDENIPVLIMQIFNVFLKIQAKNLNKANLYNDWFKSLVYSLNYFFGEKTL